MADLLRREFIVKDFAVQSFGPVRWLDGGKSYAILEPSAKAEGVRDLVRYDTATAQRELMLSALQLTPPGSDKPLAIEDYAWSADMNRVLIFTNSRRTWRENTRGDYWVLVRTSGALRKLEGGYIDSTRVAVWGRSGGGSNTLNLVFHIRRSTRLAWPSLQCRTSASTTVSTRSGFVGLPQEDASGCKAGSAINFVEGLQGKLFLVHGSGDDNVHYQGTELPVNRLIELGKPFDFMIYPGRTHAIVEGPETADHLYCLLARYLEEHFPSGTGTAAR